MTEVGLDGMTETERLMADNIYAAMMKSMHDTDRSAQAKEFRVGVSDLGFCSERTRRMLNREDPEEIDMLPAFHGTWLGEGIERAVGVAYPESLIQSEVTVPLQGETNEYEITGHPDIVFPTGLVLDVKSSFGLSIPAKTGLEDQGKKFQRHCYAYGALRDGLITGVPEEAVTVGNVWVDRSAEERRLLVKTEPFSMDVVREATEWLDEVVYAWRHKEEARKEPPIEMCKKVCGFFEPCRGTESRAEGLLTDPDVIEAVHLDIEGAELAKRAKRMRDEAKSTLRGLTGSTGTYQVYWQHFNATKVEAFERAPYDVLRIKEIKK